MNGLRTKSRVEAPEALYSLGFRVWKGAPRVMPRAHLHTDLECNFLTRGAMRYFMAGRFYRVAAERLVILWAGMPHRLVEVASGTECIWITLPLAWYMPWGLDAAFTRRLLSGELLLDPAEDPASAGIDRAAHERWIVDLREPHAERQRAAMLEVEARIRRLALAVAAARPARRSPEAGGAAERIARYIGQRYREDLSVADVADGVGLHPNYAMQLFKRSCGMSIGEYLARLRVSHAQRLLLTGTQKILDVALDAGFQSASRFYETFRRYAGRTPRAYRRAHAGSSERATG